MIETPQEDRLEQDAMDAVDIVYDYYAHRVFLAAQAVLMAAPDMRDETLDAQVNLTLGVLAKVLGGHAILCGLSSEKTARELGAYGIPTTDDGQLDYQAVAWLMLQDDIIQEMTAQEFENNLDTR